MCSEISPAQPLKAQAPSSGVENWHIVVAHPNVCLCGKYGDESIGCGQILHDINWLIKYSKSLKALRIARLLNRLSRDVNASPVSASTVSEKEGDVKMSYPGTVGPQPLETGEVTAASSTLAATSLPIVEIDGKKYMEFQSPEELIAAYRASKATSHKPEGKTLGQILYEKATELYCNYIVTWDGLGFAYQSIWETIARAVADHAVRPYDRELTSMHQRWADKVVELAKANQELSLAQARADETKKALGELRVEHKWAMNELAIHATSKGQTHAN